MSWRHWLLLLLLLVPLAGAERVEPITWSERIYSADSFPADWSGASKIVNVTAPHNYTVLARETSLLVALTITVDTGASDQDKEIHIDLNGERLTFCTLLIRDDGSLGVPGVDSNYGGHRCPTIAADETEQFLMGQNNTFFFNNSGSAAVGDFYANVYLMAQDKVIIPESGSMADEITLTTALDFWIPILILGGLFFLAIWRDYLFLAIVASIGVAMEFFDTPSIARVGIIFLALTALWLEYLGRMPAIFLPKGRQERGGRD